MNVKLMIRIHAWILILETIFMVPALIISLATGDRPAATGFAVTMALAVGIALVTFAVTRHAERRFYAREGLVTTGLAWIVMSLIGALPFFISGRIPKYVDCFFEIVSGFTTTGASICPDVEILGKGLLYWRSFSHWIGGMGVLVFFLAIIPANGRNDGYTLHILRAESPGPSVNKIVPRMRDTAGILYALYCLLTILCIVFLLIGRMPVFDAFCMAFGTAGTGGFSILNSGYSTYTPFAQNVTTIFMLLFGVNFSLYYLLTLRRFRQVGKDEELRLYAAIVAASIILIAINIFGKTDETASLEPTVRHAAFQVASIITTTGYATVDFNGWPALSKGILLCLMFVGACAGSTGGGIKVSRVLLLWKIVRRNLHTLFHPNEVRVIKMNGQRVSEQTVRNVTAYLAAYVFILIISFLLVSADPANLSVTSNFSAVMATFNNIGPGLDAVGPASNFSAYSDFSTFVLSIDMLLGRLEIFPILALMTPDTYRRA